MGNEIKIYPSVYKTLSYLISVLFIVGIAIISIGMLQHEQIPEFILATLLVIVAILYVINFIFDIELLLFAIGDKPIIIINEFGLWDRRLFKGPLSWSHLAAGEFKKLNGSYEFAIKFKIQNAKTFRSLIKNKLRVNMLITNNYSLNLGFLAIENREMIKILNSYGCEITVNEKYKDYA